MNLTRRNLLKRALEAGALAAAATLGYKAAEVEPDQLAGWDLLQSIDDLWCAAEFEAPATAGQVQEQWIYVSDRGARAYRDALESLSAGDAGNPTVYGVPLHIYPGESSAIYMVSPHATYVTDATGIPRRVA